MGIDEAGTLARLQHIRSEIIDPTIAAYSGRTIKLMGDGALLEFASVVDAVACALEIQKFVRERNSVGPEHRSIQFRIGINVGDVIVDGDDIYGDGVNVAARIEALADPGSVYLARAAADEVRDKLPITLEPRGERRVKNVARPIEVFRASVREADTNSSLAHDAASAAPRRLCLGRPKRTATGHPTGAEATRNCRCRNILWSRRGDCRGNGTHSFVARDRRDKALGHFGRLGLR